MVKPYSQLALAVDLVMNEYKISNPIEIVELIQQDLSLYFTVHQVMDYLDINKLEDYEKESELQEFKMYY